jgi:hypothetical protein
LSGGKNDQEVDLLNNISAIEDIPQ